MASSRQTPQRRIRELEARRSAIEGGHGEAQCALRRAVGRADLRLGRVVAHLGIADVTDDEVDAAVEEQEN